LPGIKDSDFIAEMKSDIKNLITDANERQRIIIETVNQKIET